MRTFPIRASLFACAIALVALGCDAGPRDLVSGEDPGRYCRMTIDDVRFGAMVKTSHGKIETFDSIECLASFVASLPDNMKPQGVWVADFAQPRRWIAVDSARFVHTSALKSPMGRELAAFGTSRPDSELASTYGGRVLDWPSVQAMVLSTPFAPRGSSATLRDSVAVASASHTH
jgi:copper chaperone NosL